jgi:Sigma-70 region 2
VVKREQSRLRNFIRRRVPDPRDAEDILQDVFYKLVEANRLLMLNLSQSPLRPLSGKWDRLQNLLLHWAIQQRDTPCLQSLQRRVRASS